MKIKYYSKKLKEYSRKLRNNQTDAEKLLWYRIRRKQVLGVQFYRQKPIDNYIVDFYAPAVNMVIELDGSQHFIDLHKYKDAKRDQRLNELGFLVLRFDNYQVLRQTQIVLNVIHHEIAKSPRFLQTEPCKKRPPLRKGMGYILMLTLFFILIISLMTLSILELLTVYSS